MNAIKKTTVGHNTREFVPPLRIKRSVICQIMRTIGAMPPESGGILLGPIGTNDITDFYFDVTARCSGGTYSPDHVTLQRKLDREWLPARIDYKGFAHSHPNGFDRLSAGDLRYIERLLVKNPDMPLFAAPIVIPDQFRMRAIVVMRDQPNVPRFTHFRIF